MRPLCLFLFSASVLAAQPIGFGLKAGVPTNDFLSAAQNQNLTFATTTNRYVLGPTVELRLPFGLGVELDALYRHFGYSFVNNTAGAVINASTSSGSWEFPLVAKYKFKLAPLVHPYVEAGVSWDRLAGLTQDVSTTVANITHTSSTSNPAELKNDTVRGFVVGAGLDIKLLVLHITPGLRYTHWGSQHFFDPTGLLGSNQSQGEFLVGITF
jgi:opacity protein-like surface antigen